MEIGWLESLLYGLLSGFTEFVPVSAQAHGAILRRLFGCGEIHFIDQMTKGYFIYDELFIVLS